MPGERPAWMAMWTIISGIGELALRRWRGLRSLAAVIWAVLRLGATPRTWRRTVRAVLAEQVVAVGVDSIGIVVLIAVMVGVSVVTQAQVWLARIDQSHLVGPLLVTFVMREAAPLLVNLAVIGRSGSTIAGELGYMSVAGEVRGLTAQGIDPFHYLVVPRVIAVTLSVLCLTVAFVSCCLASGYVCGQLMGTSNDRPMEFAGRMLAAVGAIDVANMLVKCVLPAMVAGAVCCMEGLGASGTMSDVPRAVRRGLVASLAAVFVISAGMSVLTYY